MSSDRRPSEEDEKNDKYLDETRKLTVLDPFPVDDTPTPTKILRLANDLFPDFQDPKENPFDAHFRKAAEAVKSGSDRLSASISANDIPSDDSLNTPSIYPISALNTPTPFTKRAPISKQISGRSISRNLKPLLPNGPLPLFKPSVEHEPSADKAQVLLKMPSGETVKLYNVPLVRDRDVLNAAPKERIRSTFSRGSRNHSSELEEPTPRTDSSESSTTEDFKRREAQERNRYSAMRSRNRKREVFDRMKKENKHLSMENNILRQEIIKLKNILQEHIHCDVTITTNQQETVRMLIEPQYLISCSPQSSRNLDIHSPQLLGQSSDVPEQVGQICSQTNPEIYPRSIHPAALGITSLGAKKTVKSKIDEENIDLSMQLLLQQPQPRVPLVHQDSISNLLKNSGSFLLRRTDSNSESIVVLESSDFEVSREDRLMRDTRETEPFQNSLRESDKKSEHMTARLEEELDLEEIRSPPQIFPEDLRTAKPRENEPNTEPNRNSQQKPRKISTIPRKRLSRLMQPSENEKACGSRKPVVRSLGDKLLELKRKMGEDQATEEFLNKFRKK